jgi:hypothetical protein
MLLQHDPRSAYAARSPVLMHRMHHAQVSRVCRHPASGGTLAGLFLADDVVQG